MRFSVSQSPKCTKLLRLVLNKTDSGGIHFTRAAGVISLINSCYYINKIQQEIPNVFSLLIQRCSHCLALYR